MTVDEQIEAIESAGADGPAVEGTPEHQEKARSILA